MTGDGGFSTDDFGVVLSALRDMARASTPGVLERNVGELIRICAEATGSDRGALFLLDASKSRLCVVGTWPCDDVLGRTIPWLDVKSTRTGDQMLAGVAGAFSVADLPKAPPELAAAGMKHWVTVPLLLRGRLSGALNIARNRDERFEEREIRLLDTLAEVLTIHVENARLHGDAQRQLGETKMLLDVGRALSASLDLDGILETAVETVTRIVKASTAFVLLLEDNFLRGVASSNPAVRPLTRNVRVEMGTKSLIARAVAERMPIVVNDIENTEVELRRDLAAQLGQKSLLAVPLLTRDRPVGVVLIDDTRGPRTWTPQEIELAELVAHQVAAAVANARLFAEVKQRNEQLAHAHQQMVERERLAALGQFSATLAHEIRNPLGVLFNSVGTLTKLTPADGEEAKLLGIMTEETRRLDRLVRDLLEFARPRAPSLQLCALAPVVNGAVEFACAELVPPPRSLVVEIAANVPDVRIDPFMIRQALFNLVLNAGQAAGPNGAIVIRGTIDDECDRLRIDVTDDGPGICAENAKRIFEPFFTTKPTGTGLGLVIVKSIIDSHNGELRVGSSASGRGTTVSAIVPFR